MIINSIIEKAAIYANYYYDYFITHPCVLHFKQYITMSSSSLSSLTITDEPLINQLNDVYFAVEAKLNGCECAELVENCKKLYQGSKKVIEIAKEYQYNGIQANGYWTYIRLVIKFGKTILSTYHRGRTDEEALLSASHVLVTGLDLCEKFHQGSQVDKDNDPRLSPNLMSPSSVDIIDLLKVFESLTPQLDVVYGNYCAFWVCGKNFISKIIFIFII